MADLGEYVRESFTKSALTDDHSDRRNDQFEDDGNFEGNNNNVAAQAPKPSLPPPIRKKGNTGPKGVLMDYAEHVENERLEREVAQLKNEYLIKKMTITTMTAREQEKLKKLEEQEKLEREDLEKQRSDEEEDGDELDDDDEFFAQYKAKRITEIQSTRNPTFGYLQQITQDEYVDAIDNTNPQTHVVIHLYQPYIPDCSKLNNYLQQLAVAHPTTKFLRIIASEASEKFTDTGLPTLLVYRAGNLVHSWIRMQDILKANFDIDSVQDLLYRNGVISKKATLQ